MSLRWCNRESSLSEYNSITLILSHLSNYILFPTRSTIEHSGILNVFTYLSIIPIPRIHWAKNSTFTFTKASWYCYLDVHDTFHTRWLQFDDVKELPPIYMRSASQYHDYPVGSSVLLPCGHVTDHADMGMYKNIGFWTRPISRTYPFILVNRFYEINLRQLLTNKLLFPIHRKNKNITFIQNTWIFADHSRGLSRI